MAQTGTLIVRVFASRAELPISGASVIVSQPEPDGRQKLLAALTTNESGVAGPISLPAPDLEIGLTPGVVIPYAQYDLIVEHPNYRVARFKDLQVFSGVETIQNVPLLPLSEPINLGDSTNPTVVTPQSL